MCGPVDIGRAHICGGTWAGAGPQEYSPWEIGDCREGAREGAVLAGGGPCAGVPAQTKGEGY